MQAQELRDCTIREDATRGPRDSLTPILVNVGLLLLWYCPWETAVLSQYSIDLLKN